jgi:hypothetical protein
MRIMRLIRVRFSRSFVDSGDASSQAIKKAPAEMRVPETGSGLGAVRRELLDQDPIALRIVPQAGGGGASPASVTGGT